MRLSISKSANSVSFYVIKSVTINKKRTSKVVKKLGTLEELKLKLDGQDPYEWAREEVRRLNEEEKSKTIEVIAKFSNSKLIPKCQKRSFNCGHLFLEAIYKELGLNKICSEIKSRNKFKYNLNEIFKTLIITRVLFPASKKSSLDIAKNLIKPPSCELHQIYRALSVFDKEMEFIQSSLYEASKKCIKRNTSILYYDCTNYFFEIEDAAGIKQYGYSKESRPNPIVQMGLIMDGNGLPLAFCINPGNTNEQTTLIPLETKILRDFKLTKFIMCTDAGINSHNNRIFNSIGNRAYVVTQSLKTLKSYLVDWALDPNDWHKVGSSQLVNLNEIDELKEANSIYYKSRPIKEKDLEEQLIVTFSPKYKHYLRELRQNHINRAEVKLKNPASLKKKRSSDVTRFISSTHCTEDGIIATKEQHELAHETIIEEERYDGFYGVCTNLDADPLEIVKINKRRWEIEKCFRIMKHEFKARPVYLRRDERIRAHFITCFVALLIYKILEIRVKNKLKDKKMEQVSGGTIVKTLKAMSLFEMQGEGYVPSYERDDLTDVLHELFAFRTDTEIITKKDLNKIIKKVA